jgi:SAM-dependent methyltransferase
MSESPTSASETAAWRQFWTGRAPGGEHRYRDPQTASVLRDHWRSRFAVWFGETGVSDIVDLACGEGEVLQLAVEFAAERDGTALTGFCTDIAPDAVAMAAVRAGGAGIAADCSRLPFTDGAFGIVVSQFGLEYAGADAFGEAGRIVAPGGVLHALVHCRNGLIERSCRDIADLLTAVRRSAMLERLAEYTDTIPRAVRGETAHETAQACVAALRTAVEQVGAAVTAAPPGPARDHVVRLLQDSQTLTQRLAAYAPADVEAWIAAQSAEIEAFQHRMSSMLRVAQPEAGMHDLAARLTGEGLAVSGVETLPEPQHGQPLAWILEARRPI